MFRHKRKLLLTTLLVLSSLLVLDSCSTNKKTVSHHGTAFNAPDYKQIKKAVNIKGGEFYYPELLRRFEAADTTLTREQAYYFYYGTATLPDHNPYKFENYEAVSKALSGDNITEENWRKAAEAIEKQLQSDPTNLRFHVYKQMAYSYVYGKESREYLDAVFQVNKLLSAIMSTGDGRTMESAFHVISVTDEYGFMDILGVSLKSQSLLNNKGQSYDLMELKENSYGLKSLYFNVSSFMKTSH